MACDKGSLTSGDVREMFRAGESVASIARHFGLPEAIVAKIVQVPKTRHSIFDGGRRAGAAHSDFDDRWFWE